MTRTIPMDVNQSTAQAMRRTLAAVMFTDVVSFSKSMGEDEEGTLKKVERDFALMRTISKRNNGEILKTLGDGLLIYFNSAVEAVRCALEFQRAIHQQTKQNPQEALKHRVGIHLGDIFVTEHEVLGDGVNIAARLQAEAEPGGICISQTVYDVVKNKLEVVATNIGPRDLKNIKDSISAYSLLIDAELGQTFQQAASTAQPPPSQPSQPSPQSAPTNESGSGPAKPEVKSERDSRPPTKGTSSLSTQAMILSVVVILALLVLVILAAVLILPGLIFVVVEYL